MKKVIVLILAVVILATGSVLLLSACNRSSMSYLDVYLNYDEVNEFANTEHIVSLPEGYSLYLTNNDNIHASSDYGYQQSVNGFIITNGNVGSYAKLNFIVAGENKLLFPENSEIIQMQVRYGLIAVMTAGTSIGVYDIANREWVLPLVKPRISGASLTASIELYCKILSPDYFAVAPTADNYIQSQNLNEQSNRRIPIYSVAKKEMIGRLEFSIARALSYIEGFDNYVVMTGEKSALDYAQTKIVKLSDDVENLPSLEVIKPTNNGEFTAFTSNTTDFIDVTYFGGGKFLIHQETVGSKDAYFYKELGESEETDKFWQVYRWIYQADTDTRTVYESDILLLSIVNEHYRYSAKKKDSFDASAFLKPGYSYVGYALYRNSDKTTDYDQFIIDRDFNIVLSLSRNFGMNFENEEDVVSTSFYELILTYAGGRGVVQVGTGIMRLYGEDGSVVCENDEHDYITAAYNSGMVVCSILDTVNTTGTTKKYLFGAIDEQGNITVPFIYTKLSMFTGFYAIGERDINGKTAVVLVGKNGYETQLGLNGIPAKEYSLRYNSAGTPIYKAGCYVYYSGEGDNLLYGLKNTNINVNQNVITGLKFKQVVLYSPEKGYGLVYAVVKEQGKATYDIYKLV